MGKALWKQVESQLVREGRDQLKGIAGAEAAEVYFKRAKDIEGLAAAVEEKLERQGEFVVWWDEQEKAVGAKGNPGGRGAKVVPLQDGNGTFTLESLGLDRLTVHRWRVRLKDPEKRQAAKEAAVERCRRVCEAEKGATEQRGASGTGENEWYTPAEYLDAARQVLGAFDLDPASSEAAQAIVQAERFYTKEDDGLVQDWNGRVWLNPPYTEFRPFVDKLLKEWSLGHTTAAILLTHNYTDTAWFQDAAGIASAICFTRGRVKFYDKFGNVAAPTQGQSFFYFGPDVDRFAERFREVGFVVQPV